MEYAKYGSIFGKKHLQLFEKKRNQKLSDIDFFSRVTLYNFSYFCSFMVIWGLILRLGFWGWGLGPVV